MKRNPQLTASAEKPSVSAVSSAPQKKALPNGRGQLAKRDTSPSKKGGILAALRRSPLVGADLNLARSREFGRKVDL